MVMMMVVAEGFTPRRHWARQASSTCDITCATRWNYGEETELIAMRLSGLGK
jgi:hypothetical protein